MKVHLIGIAGTGMGGLARLLADSGHEVRGSDVDIYPPMSDQLASAGIPVSVGYDAANLAWEPEVVVVGNVCRADHPEVLAAKERGLQLESFPSMFARALLPGHRSLVVAGTHGKTTTTALLAWLLAAVGEDPSFLVGGVPVNFGTGAHRGKGRHWVLEGDEYDTAFFDKKSKFLHYRPNRAILTGVEFDHADIFDSLEQVRDAFIEFVETIDPRGDLVVCRDDPEAMGVAAHAPCRVRTYRVMPPGVQAPEGADYCALIREPGPRRTVFEVFEQERSLGLFSTQLLGRYNIANLTAALAVAVLEGVDPEALRLAVLRFRGVRKRQELLGMAAGVRVIFDFAHHPTAVDLTVKAIRKRYPDKSLHVCFEPRSSSSKRSDFAGAYATSFDAATDVFIAPVHRPDKVPEGRLLDTAELAKAISARGVPAKACKSIDSLGQAVLERAVPGDTVLLLSSGSFGDLPEQLLYGFGDPVTFAAPRDMPAVCDLLVGYGLPPVVAAEEVETLVMRSPDGIVGCVSLHVADKSAFLFGLAVAPQRRGEGLGWVLGDIVLRRARNLGAKRCYLITNTATDFFADKLGFSRLEAHEVDEAIRGSADFAESANLPDAVCMVLDLDAGSGR